MSSYGGKTLPQGYKARFWTDRENFVICHIHKIERVVKNGSGKVKHVKLSDQPVAVGRSLVNHDAGDAFDVVNGVSMPGIGKHIALQRAIAAMPQKITFSLSRPKLFVNGEEFAGTFDYAANANISAEGV